MGRRPRRWSVWVGGTLVVFALVLGGLALRDRESKDRATFIREHPEFVHDLADLDRGTTHYELAGGDGSIVVMVHGVSGPLSVWDETCRTLRSSGRGYVRLDLYGRGASSRLDPPVYDLGVYVEQVTGLIERVAPGAPFHLVGSSMGAIVVSEVAKKWPERTLSVTLVGPAGFKLEATAAARFMNVPLVGEYAMKAFGDGLLAQHQRKYFVEPERFEAQHALFGAQLEVRGSKRAILETMRRVPLQGYEAGYRALAAIGRPVLVLWGTEDRAFPFTHARELHAMIPEATIVAVPAAGHLPQLERADLVGPRIVAWIGSHER